MDQNLHFRILAIHLSAYGVGYSVLERTRGFIDCGVARARKNKNAACRQILDKLLTRYAPDLLVLPDLGDNDGYYHSSRIKRLCASLVRMAEKRNVSVKLINKIETRKHLLGAREGTKHQVAKVVAEKFSAELASSLPPPRDTADNEDYRMGIFEATAMAVTKMDLASSEHI